MYTNAYKQNLRILNKVSGLYQISIVVAILYYFCKMSLEKTRPKVHMIPIFLTSARESIITSKCSIIKGSAIRDKANRAIVQMQPTTNSLRWLNNCLIRFPWHWYKKTPQLILPFTNKETWYHGLQCGVQGHSASTEANSGPCWRRNSLQLIPTISRKSPAHLRGARSQWKDGCWLLWPRSQFLAWLQAGCCPHRRCCRQCCSQTGRAPGTRFQVGLWATGCWAALLRDHLEAENQTPQTVRRT